MCRWGNQKVQSQEHRQKIMLAGCQARLFPVSCPLCQAQGRLTPAAHPLYKMAAQPRHSCTAQAPSCHTQPFCPTHCVFTPDNCTALHSAAIASQPLWNPIRNADFSFAGDLPLAGPSSAEQRPLRQEPWPLATALGPYPHQPSPFHKEGELEEPGWTRGHLPQVAILLSVLLLRGKQAGGT